MEASLTDAQWAQIAGLKVRLHSGVRIHRHVYRGQVWYVLQDQASTRHYRFDAGTRQLLELLDGSRSVQDIHDTLCRAEPQSAPSRDTLLGLLARLHDADMIQYNVAPDAEQLIERRRRDRRRKWRQQLARPLALRFPLLDPDALLTRALPMVRPLFGPLGFLVWLLTVSVGLALATSHGSGLAEHWSTRALDTNNLVLLWLSYPTVKILHELGHAFATKVWGGEVHEMGLMLLVLTPVPYVDASAASAFADKHRRMVVGAAGIMVETFLAALALIAWVQLPPGELRDIAFNIALIGGISTLLFNGNPLLRFDGYYVLADALEIPNLGARADRYLGYLGKRYLCGLREAPSPVSAPGERAWFLGYGLAAFAYRLFISLSIALFIAGKLFFVGVLLALWVLLVQVVYPLLRLIGNIARGTDYRGRRLRAAAVTLSTAGLAATLVFAVPVPSWTRAEGVIQLPEDALVRVRTDGWVARVLREHGEAVRQGEVLVELHDPELGARLEELQWKLRELQARHQQALVADRLRAGTLADDIADAQAELAEVRERVAGLTLHSPADGVLDLPDGGDLPGRFLRKGDLLGQVADRGAASARIVVPQQRVDLVRRHTERVGVRLPAHPDRSLAASLQSTVPAATRRLPSAALGSMGGGDISVDASDGSGTTTIDRVFQFDLALPEALRDARVGSRVLVRLDHPGEPLAGQWYRRLRELFLTRLQL